MSDTHNYVENLDGDDVDQVTARAIQLLAAADLYAEQHRQPRPRRGWHDPAVMTILLIAVSIVLLALGYLRTSQIAGALSQTSHDNRQTLNEIRSCTTPTGRCAQRGAAAQAAAIDQIVLRIVRNNCKVFYATAPVHRRRCLANAARQ